MSIIVPHTDRVIGSKAAGEQFKWNYNLSESSVRKLCIVFDEPIHYRLCRVNPDSDRYSIRRWFD